MEIGSYIQWFKKEAKSFYLSPNQFIGQNNSVFNYIQAYIFNKDRHTWNSHAKTMNWATMNKISPSSLEMLIKVK